MIGGNSAMSTAPRTMIQTYGHEALEDLCRGNFGRRALHREQDVSERRRDAAHDGDDQEHRPEPDFVKAVEFQERLVDRDQHQHDRDRIKKHQLEHERQCEHGEQHDRRGQREGGNDLAELLRRAGVRQQLAEHHGAAHDHQKQAGDGRRRLGGFPDHPLRQPAVVDAHDHRAEHAGRGRFGRRRHTEHDQAHDHEENERARQHSQHGGSLGASRLRSWISTMLSGARLGSSQTLNQHIYQEHHHQHQAGKDAGDQHGGGRDIGDRGDHDREHARRDDRIEARSCHDRAGRQAPCCIRAEPWSETATARAGLQPPWRRPTRRRGSPTTECTRHIAGREFVPPAGPRHRTASSLRPSGT